MIIDSYFGSSGPRIFGVDCNDVDDPTVILPELGIYLFITNNGSLYCFVFKPISILRPSLSSESDLFGALSYQSRLPSASFVSCPRYVK